MNIILDATKEADGHLSKLFSIFLNIEDVVKILDAPLYITEPLSGIHFCIFVKDIIDEKNIHFECMGNNCSFFSKKSFKTSQHHLEWFTSLGKIPIKESTPYFRKNSSANGYAQFLDEKKFRIDAPKDSPLNEFFLRKMMKLELIH